MSPKIDPITRSVVQHRLSSIVKEMGEAMLRTSYSQILNSSRDFSLAICDTDARLIAQADHLPVHVGALPWATIAVEERFKDIKPGDVILLNDPYHGGSHLPDVTVFVPVFAGEKRLLWTIVRAHQSDIGGGTHGAYNPAATEIWQEGLRIPPIKLYEAGKLRDDLFDMLALNVRNPREFRGDLSAMLGAANLGERRVAKLFSEFGAPVVEAAIGAILDATEQQTRAVVSAWKDGVFHGEAFLDDDGHGRTDIRIAAKVTKKGSDVEVDLSDSDPQSTSFVNSSHANMQAAVAMAFAYLIDAEIPKNTGALRPLKVIAKQGTIVWADPGRPVTLCTSHPSNEIVEAIVKALSASCPERAMAGWSRRFRIAIQGEDPRSGKSFIWHLFQARPGGGASSGGDGWSSIGEWHSVGGLKFGSLEVAEVRFPLHFRTHEFRENSGGDGQHRGGLGVSLDLVLETEKVAKGNTAGDGARHGPCGMLGGKDGEPHHYRLLSEGREPRVLRTKEVGIELRAGDCLEIRSSGGGGWGPPEKRSAEARQRDREQGMTDVTAGAGIPMMFRIGVDVGGTYTDLVATDDNGRTVFAKSPSTPADQSLGVMAGLDELARRLNVTREQMLAATDRLVHGTTVATNALLERNGAKVALLTTAGHRDVIEMREGLKPDRYDLRSPPPAPLVPRERRFGVKERLRANGEVLIPLDPTSLDDAIAGIRQSGATSVAVCFLHSYLNPVHELAAVERLKQALPEISISRSSDVLPQIKEYERVSTTIVNAYVEPIVRRYLTNLETRLTEAGFKGSLFVVLSHGGMAPVEEASRLAAGTVLSGPAGGMSGGRRCADLIGIPDLVPFDMGGTSTDISLIEGGHASLSADGMLAGQRIALRSLDIASIAAGGGSIASVDASRTLRVGPESAGSVPGPACYGNGGQAATVTDANVVLGYLDASAFMGGKRPLDRAASEAAVDRIAEAMDLSRVEAAAGIYRMINLNMADGIRLMTLRRGVDPRKFALLSFGGAAGLHAAEVARELEIKRIIVPTVASVLSAWGMLTSDLRYEVSRTHYGAGRISAGEVRELFAGLEQPAAARLRSWFNGKVAIERSAELRYGEQIFEIDVSLDGLGWDVPDLVDRIEDRFHARHEELYTYASRGQEVVFVNARVAAVGEVSRLDSDTKPASSSAACAPRGERQAFFGDWREVPVYALDDLQPGHTLAGPAIIEAETTTVLIDTGDSVTVNALGWLDISLR